MWSDISFMADDPEMVPEIHDPDEHVRMVTAFVRAGMSQDEAETLYAATRVSTSVQERFNRVETRLNTIWNGIAHLHAHFHNLNKD
jgi:hypothetical protein